MEAQDWAIIITTVLSVLGLRDGVPKLAKWVSGSASRRRSEVDRMAKERDLALTHKRIIREHASLLRRMLFEAPCVPPESVPPYPDLPKE